MTSPQPESDLRDRFTEYALDPVTIEGAHIEVVVWLRANADGAWRGGLQFTHAETGETRTTAEILRGGTEADLWQSVRGLRTHHLRDLYRSLAPPSPPPSP